MAEQRQRKILLLISKLLVSEDPRFFIDVIGLLFILGQFVVNIMSSWFVDSANHTCGNFPPEINEMEVAGLSSLPSDLVKPPRVGESAVNLECEVTFKSNSVHCQLKHTIASIVSSRCTN